MKTFLIFYGQILSSSIARHSKLIVIFFTCRLRLAYVEKPIDFWLRKGKAVGETKPTENKYGT